MTHPAPTRMPVLFLGHGTPMNAVSENRWTAFWSLLGQQLGRPRALLVISAHWCTRGVGVTAMAKPPTIHDFGGFPQILHDMQYPAPGDPALAASVRDLLAPLPVHLDQDWGLDHGTWAVLCKLFPAADIPIVQLSIDMTQPPEYHLEVGRKLSALREEGVLIIGSGNVVHNLRLFQRHEAAGFDWAVRFNDQIREAALAGDTARLVHYLDLGDDACKAVPTPDHYYPLLYAAGAGDGDAAVVEIDGVEMGSMSMLSLRWGDQPGAASHIQDHDVRQPA